MSNKNESWNNWLVKNQSLRMDATEDFFSENARNIHLKRYEFAKHYCAGKRVLDGACGTGYGSNLIASVAKNVVGIDFSEDAIDYARSKFQRDNLVFDTSFVEHTPFQQGSFDVVVSFETVEHTLCPRSHMREVARLLEADTGVAILSIPNGWGLTDHHFFDFDLDSFRDLLTPNFQSIEYFAQKGNKDKGNIGEIIPGTDDTLKNAYCILAVCRFPVSKESEPNLRNIMEEIYEASFKRHNEFRALDYKVNTSIFRRIINKLNTMLP